MAIGRTFEEAIQKGLRMVGQGMHGFVGNNITIPDIDEELLNPTDKRIFAIAAAFEKGYTIEKIHDMTKIDNWFLERLNRIHRLKNELDKYSTITGVSSVLLRQTKQTIDYQRKTAIWSSKDVAGTRVSKRIGYHTLCKTD